MGHLTFYLQDRRNQAERQAIAETLSQLDLQPTAAELAELIIVHRSSDGLGKTLGVSVSAVNQCLSRSGIYIEYTTDPQAHWQKTSTCTYIGSHAELLRRLSSLTSPISLATIRAALHPETPCLITLLILCQGYLAAETSISEPTYWQLVKSPEFRLNILQEWGGGPAEFTNGVEPLLSQITQGQSASFTVVRAAYEAISQNLVP